jgi:glycosyltransferase involved in cell wall biosynthesis
MLVSTDMSHDARVWKEARTLAEQGHEVTVLAAYNAELPLDETNDGIRVIRVTPKEWRRLPASTVAHQNSTAAQKQAAQPVAPKGWLGSIRAQLWDFRAFVATLFWVAKLDPDVVHVHDADRLLRGGFAHWLLGKPLVYDAHEYFTGLTVDNTLKWRLARWWFIALERLFAPQARAVITVNEAIGRKLRARYRLSQVVILHNFPNLNGAPAKENRLRDLVPLEHRHRPILLYQGRLTASRGIEEFIATIAQVPEAVGVIIGGGPLEKRFKDLAVQSGAGNRTIFVPQVPWEELAALTAGADLGFCLSQNSCENNYLALPNKLFEYIMAGVPVVASDFPVLREYVVREQVGAVVAPDNPSRIAAVIGELLRQPDRLAAMRENAHRVSRTKYNWETQADALRALYRRLDSKVLLQGGR